MGTVLVAFATRYGSTREVAEYVAERLRERGMAVVIAPVSKTDSIDEYDAVVLAAPFYIGSMLKDAREFLERHRQALERKPVALLTLGPLSAEENLQEAREQLDKAIVAMPWLKPVAAEMFVGKYDPDHLRFLDKLVAKLPVSPLRGMPAHDDRDWNAINGWADRLPEALGVSQ